MKTTTINKNEYFHNVGYDNERNGDYEMQNAIAAKWEVVKKGVHEIRGNGNLAASLKLNPETGKLEFDENWDRDDLIPTYRLMPSCLLLYKLIQIFKAMPTDKDNDWYKVTWAFPLKHKETGEFVMFGEFKAAMSYWTSPKRSLAFTDDLKELIEFLATDKVAHTYDRVSAGSIA
jgi:hypothetical protein